MVTHALLAVAVTFLAYGDLPQDTRTTSPDFSTALAQGMSAPSISNGFELTESERHEVLALSNSLASLADKRLRYVSADNEDEVYARLTAEWLERINTFLKAHVGRPDDVRKAMIEDAIHFAGTNGAKRPMELYRFLQHFVENRSFIGQDETLVYL